MVVQRALTRYRKVRGDLDLGEEDVDGIELLQHTRQESNCDLEV